MPKHEHLSGQCVCFSCSITCRRERLAFLTFPVLEESRRSPRVAAAKQWEVAAHNAFKGGRASVQKRSARS